MSSSSDSNSKNSNGANKLEGGGKDVGDRVLASLMKPKSKPTGPIIQEVNPDGSVITSPSLNSLSENAASRSNNSGSSGGGKSNSNSGCSAPTVLPVNASTDGPSLFDEMIAAQKAAKKEADAMMEKSQEADSKSAFSGMKKGFFNSTTSSGSDKNTSSSSSTSSSSNDSRDGGIISLSKPKPSAQMKAKDSSLALLVDEVQEGLKREENPTVAKLKEGEWMTPDLLQKFQANEILRKGLTDPKCMEALQQLQSVQGGKGKPGDAILARLKSDPFIDNFLREFGKVMGEHFEALEAKSRSSGGGGTDSNNNNSNSNSGSGTISAKIQPIQEIGPLHAEVLRRQRDAQSGGGSSSGINNFNNSKCPGGDAACSGIGVLRCSRCKAVFYCTAVCQKAHWKIHKATCTPSATEVVTSTGVISNKSMSSSSNYSNNKSNSNNYSSSNNSNSSRSSSILKPAPVLSEEDEKKRVDQILADEELRGMLMDPEMQKILQECNDPKTFQKHMQNPTTATKIKKLFDSGLVGMTK